jgi:L,D-transpeptidase catalytic domain/Putative peptidoglycan binding domain/PKD domain
MRRLGLVLFALVAGLASVPRASAEGGCGVTASVASGKAPLTVAFTASCTSATYTWNFADGSQATGQSVRHVFAAGSWAPTLTTDAGSESAPRVTSIALRVSAPAKADYAHYVTLKASVVPRLPITLNGRTFGTKGNLRYRVLRPAALVAHAGGVSSAPVRIQVVPTVTIRTVGAPLVGSKVRVVARLHPANAGTVIAPKLVDTRSAHVAHVVVRSRPANGWAPASASLELSVVAPDLALGASGVSVRMLENRLAELHYAVKRDGYFGSEDLEAVYAFEKVEGLPRTGTVDGSIWRRLEGTHIPFARYGGDHVEIDKTRQVLFIVRGGKVALTVATSTGATGNTPLGGWHVYRKVAGFDWVLYYPSYFLRGFAVHGYPDVPPYPASHGCARIPMWIAQTVYNAIPDGSTVYVYA